MREWLPRYGFQRRISELISIKNIKKRFFDLIMMLTRSSRIWVNAVLFAGLSYTSWCCYEVIGAIAQIDWPPLKVAHLEGFCALFEQLDWEVIAINTLPFLGLCLLTVGTNRLFYKKKHNLKTSHGSARFSTIKEIRKLNQKQGIPVGVLPRSIPDELASLETLSSSGSKEILRLNPDHVVLVAPSGAGKGVGIIIPTLLDYPGPVVVTDIKAAENYQITSRYRREQGRKIYVMDTDQQLAQASVSINVLDTLDPQSLKLVDDVGILASIIRPIPKHNAGNEKYFAEYSLAVIQCLILYVVCHQKFNQAQKHLAFIYELLCQEDTLITEMFRQIQADSHIGFGTPSRLAATVLSTTERELSGVFNSARQELRFFDSPIMRSVTSTSSIDLTEIINNNADLYICVPSEALETQGRLIRLLISAIFLKLKKQKQKPNHPLLLLLDEMPLLGHIPEVEKALIIGRGYGVKLMCVAQTIELLSSTYPHAWKTMLASNLSLFIGASDNDTAKYISEKLGQKTIEFETTNTGKSQQKSSIKPSTLKSKGESINYAARALLTPDEVAALGDNVVLAFMRGKRPILLNKIKYYEHPEWQGKWDVNTLEYEDS